MRWRNWRRIQERGLQNLIESCFKQLKTDEYRCERADISEAVHIGTSIASDLNAHLKLQIDKRRRSTHVADAQIKALAAAADHAVKIGLPLNAFKTIHWQAAGIKNDDEVQNATAHFIKLLMGWFRSKSANSAVVWMRKGAPRSGQHVHMLLHIPLDHSRGVRDHQQGWLRRCGVKPKAGVMHTRPVGNTLGLAFSDDHYSRQSYSANMNAAVEYILKGARDVALRQNDITRRGSFEGELFGKRCGTSQKIGPTAQGAWIASHRRSLSYCRLDGHDV